MKKVLKITGIAALIFAVLITIAGIWLVHYSERVVDGFGNFIEDGMHTVYDATHDSKGNVNFY